MKTKKLLLSLLVVLLISAFTVEAAKLVILVKDNFDKYANGSLVGQGNWESYVNGSNFIVQNTIKHRGKKAIYNNSLGDNVVGKAGKNPLSDGKQVVYVRTENRANWGLYPDGNA